jgi:predicted dehydrogenase
MHCEIACAAAAAGKNIYIEKPMALTIEEAGRMCEAAKKAGVRTAVGFQKRRFPSVTFAKKLISEGFIGDPMFFHGTYMQGAALDPEAAFHWRFECGPFREIGCHSIDMARYLFGEFDSICAVTETFIKERPGLLKFDLATGFPIPDPDPAHRVDMTKIAEDFGAFMVKFKNGAMGTFEISQLGCNNGDDVGFELYGTKGGIIWRATHANEIQLSSINDPADQKGFRTVEMTWEHKDCFWGFGGFGINFGEKKSIELYDALDAFVKNKPFSPDFEDAFKTTVACEKLYESVKNGNSWVKV